MWWFQILATAAWLHFFGVTAASRSLPTDLQVDLLFPRNDTTYAPTQWFPIIFGIQNLKSVLPMDIRLSTRVMGTNWWLRNVTNKWEDISVHYADPSDAGNGTIQFHSSLVSMTNGSTDTFTVAWDLEILHRCFANNTDHPERDTDDNWWSNMCPYPHPQVITFRTVPGGKLPDIEADVNSCPAPDESTSVAVRVSDARKTTRGNWCAVLDTDVKPNKCAYKSVAKELAQNVSDHALKKMHCTNGTWQTISAPCPRQESLASAPMVPSGHGIGAALSFVLAAALVW